MACIKIERDREGRVKPEIKEKVFNQLGKQLLTTAGVLAFTNVVDQTFRINSDKPFKRLKRKASLAFAALGIIMYSVALAKERLLISKDDQAVINKLESILNSKEADLVADVLILKPEIACIIIEKNKDNSQFNDYLQSTIRLLNSATLNKIQ